MKYVVPSDKLDKIGFRYLDMQYGDLEQFEPEYYKGFILKKPNNNSEYGVIGYHPQGRLYITDGLTNEVSKMFHIYYAHAKELIGRWLNKKYDINYYYVGPNYPPQSFGDYEHSFKIKK